MTGALGQYGIPESGLDPIGGLQLATETPWHPHSMSAPADRVLGPPQTRRNRSGAEVFGLVQEAVGLPYAGASARGMKGHRHDTMGDQGQGVRQLQLRLWVPVPVQRAADQGFLRGRVGHG